MQLTDHIYNYLGNHKFMHNNLAGELQNRENRSNFKGVGERRTTKTSVLLNDFPYSMTFHVT